MKKSQLILWQDFVKCCPDSPDPRCGWKKGVLIRRGESLYRLLDEGRLIHNLTWFFDAEEMTGGRKTALFKLVNDEIVEKGENS